MHDIDSTRLEASSNYNEREDRQEFESRDSQGEESFEMPMTEAEEEALAAELLGVSSEEEMDQFFGKLFRKVKRGIGGAAKLLAQNAGPLSGALKGIAAKVLPHLGGVLGTAIPIPGLGTAFGSMAGKAVSNLLQSEMENLEVEEQEFEMARRYVQLASQAFRQAARIPPRANPSTAVNFALNKAFRILRGSSGYRPQPIYVGCRPCAPCPPPEPCPTCPTCSQALPAADSPNADSGHGTTAGEPDSNKGGVAATTGEFEFEDAGELGDAGEFENTGEMQNTDQGEGAYNETDNEALTSPTPNRGHSGRWARRGQKIVLYGV